MPNPFNTNQVARVTLAPPEVEAFVFWTRNPRPLMKYLDELDDLGCRYYFLFTIIGYPARIDPGMPPLKRSIETLQELSVRVGPRRVVWRYDPIVLSDLTGTGFHERNFRFVAQELKGATSRCVISFVKPYRKARSRMEASAQGCADPIDFEAAPVQGLLNAMAGNARDNWMGIFSCSSEKDFSAFGISPSRCIDAELISELFGIRVNPLKDPYQRRQCGCAVSRDIGIYDTCLFGCSYCYATSSPERAKKNYGRHNPLSPGMLDCGNGENY